MPWWTLTALVFFLVVTLFGFVVVALGFFRMRALEATGRQLEAELEELTRKSELLEARLERADQRAELVQQRLAHLDQSLERLSVLTWALGDASKAVSAVRSAVLLRK
jgi:predicted RNase H-like nuclease (RuvC/YqgF family)